MNVSLCISLCFALCLAGAACAQDVQPDSTAVAWLGVPGDSSALARYRTSPAGALSWTGLLRAGEPSRLEAMAVGDDGGLIAAGHQDGSVRLWQAASGTLRQTLADGSLSNPVQKLYSVSALAFSPDGGRLAWTGRSSELDVHDLGTDRRVLSRPLSSTFALAFSPDGTGIFLGFSGYGGYELVDAVSGERVFRFATRLDRVRPVVFDTRAQRVAFGTLHSEINVCRTDTGQVICRINDREFPPHSDAMFGLYKLALGPEARRLYGGCGDQQLRCFDIETSQEIWAAATDFDAFVGIDVSADGRFVLAAGFRPAAEGGSREARLGIWDTADGQLVDVIELPGSPSCLQLHGLTAWIGFEDGGLGRYQVTVRGE